MKASKFAQAEGGLGHRLYYYGSQIHLGWLVNLYRLFFVCPHGLERNLAEAHQKRLELSSRPPLHLK